MSAAVAWLNAARLGPRVLTSLAEQMRGNTEDDRGRLDSRLKVNQRAPSASRALEQGRKGESPDPLDAAVLVRQLQGTKMMELVQEILEKPRPRMMEPVLHPLCAVNLEAATEVVNLCRSSNRDVARRARQARAWADVAWPQEEPEEELHTFTPLGEGI